MMHEVGLHPSDTGEPGGKEVGQKVSHYIVKGGRFDKACAELVRGGYAVAYVEAWSEESNKARSAKSASKTKYTCPACGLNAWAKPDVALVCGECNQPLEAEIL